MPVSFIFLFFLGRIIIFFYSYLLLIPICHLIYLTPTLSKGEGEVRNDLWWFCRGCSPLPIPNREVKPLMADGTAQQCGRVGSCHIYLKKPFSLFWKAFLFCMYYTFILLSKFYTYIFPYRSAAADKPLMADGTAQSR